MKLFINNGMIVDPASGTEAPGSIVIEDGLIKEICLQNNNEKQPDSDFQDGRIGGTTGTKEENQEADVIIDAGGKWIVPGLIDLHVHLREPGFEYKEDIESGCRSAAKGGFTTVCCMPNTNPVIDNSYIVLLIDCRAKDGNGVRVLSIGAVTKGQQGVELADYEAMLRTGTKWSEFTGGGICGISEDGKTVQDRELMREAMQKAKELGLVVFSHAEPETEIVRRDIALAEETGCKLHFCHISEKQSIELIRDAKQRGLNVTAETAPHYFTLSCDDVNCDPNRKMNPPLRRSEDVEAVRQALKDGTIDAIATDHAPHHTDEKSMDFEKAPNGVIGLETSFAVSYTELVKSGLLTPLELVSKMSVVPAKILGIGLGRLSEGMPADLAVIDWETEYEIHSESFLSKGKNSPFLGKKVYGRTACTIIGGEIAWIGDDRIYRRFGND